MATWAMIIFPDSSIQRYMELEKATEIQHDTENAHFMVYFGNHDNGTFVDYRTNPEAYNKIEQFLAKQV